MRKIIFIILVSLIGIYHPFELDAEGATEFWQTSILERHWKGPWSISLEQKFRFGSGLERLNYEHTDLGLIYQKLSWLKVSANYQFLLRRQDKKWEKETRPNFNVTHAWRWLNLNFSDRHRVEFEMQSRTKDIWRYRNKLKVGWPLQWTRYHLSPFIADEIFLDFDQDEFNYQQISVGWEFVVGTRVSGELFYLWQDAQARGIEPDTNAVGLQIHWLF